MAKTAKQAIKDAPVTSLTTVESVVGFVLTFLVAHHMIGDIDVTATTQTVAPFIALAVPALFGAVKWRLVTPWEKAKDVAERDGAMSDADYARIEAMVQERLEAALAHNPVHINGALDARPDPRPGGMSAGDVGRHLAISGRR
jgi:hypothetical protein